MTDSPQDNDKTQSFAVIAPGVQVSRYKVLSKVGAGGMGEIFLAEDSSLNRKVALKFLPPVYSSDKLFRSRFLREAKTAAAMNHPNIITIHEIAEHEDRLFIAMEFLEGKSLHEVIGKEGRLDSHRALDYTIQAARGLQAAHSLGIIHRDIKPDNLFVTKIGPLKVLDFGLAKADTDAQLTQAGTTMGTVYYMSPEQAQGMPLDHRSDIFSLGVVMYELLTGHKPFMRGNMPATIHAVVHDEPEPLARMAPGLDPNIQLIIDRSLAKNLLHRYQSIDIMLADLERCHSGQPATPTTNATVTVGVSPFSQTAVPGQVQTKIAVQSLAILYLRNLGSPDDEFLSYGITEDLIVDLSRVGTIRVTPMRSILKYKDSDAELEEIAAKLNVGLIFDGSIHKSGDSIRASAQLLDIHSGASLWSDRIEEPLDNLPKIKQFLAEGVSSVLNISTSVVRAAEVGRPEARNPEAYEHYLRAKYAFNHKKDASDLEVAQGLYESALELEPTLLSAHAGMAQVLIQKGEFEEANLKLIAALSEARRRKSRNDEAAIQSLFAHSHEHQSRWDEAEKNANEALKIYEELGNLAGEAEAIASLVQILLRRTKFEEALKYYKRILEINNKLDDQHKAAEAFKNMGNIYHRMGKHEKARQLYQQGLELAERRDDAALQAACLSNIGITSFYTGDFKSALSHYEQALQIDWQLGDREGVATRYNNMAIIHLARGDFSKAQEHFGKAADAYKQLGERGNYVLAYNNVAGVLATVGEYDQAIDISRESLEIAEEIEYPLAVTYAYDYLGQAYFGKGEEEQGLSYYEKALEVASEADLTRNVAFSASNLGEKYFYLNQPDRSREYFQRALEHATEAKKKESILKASAYLAALDAKTETDASLEKLRAFAKEAKAQPDPVMTAIVQRLLGQAQLVFGGSEKNRQQGSKLLKETLSLVQKKSMAFETVWIEKILQEFS